MVSNVNRHIVYIFAVGLIARLAFLLAVSHPELRAGRFELSHSTDESDYHRLAANFAAQGSYSLSPEGPPTALRPPGTVLPIALLYLAFGPRPLLGVAYVLLCSLATVAVVGALAREIRPPPGVPEVAMLVAAGLPTAIFTAGGIWSDTPTLLFLLLALGCLLRARQRVDRQRTLVAAAALSFGLAYLNRPSALLTAAVAGAILLARSRSRREVVTAALYAALCAAPILAWGLWNQARLGRFFIGNTQSTVTLWQANNEVTAGLRPPARRFANGVDLHQEASDGRYRGSWIPLSYIAEDDPWSRHSLPEMEAEKWLKEQVTDFVRRHPAAVLQLLGDKAWRIVSAEPTAPSVLAESPLERRLKRWVTLAERWFLLVAGGFGLGLLWRRDRATAVDHLGFLAAGLAVAFVAYPNARILLPVSAILIVPAALTLVRIAERFRPSAAGPSEPHRS